jgi:hypothetical protein
MMGCAQQQPTLQTGAEAEVTHDGLVRIDHSAMQYAWIKPDINLSAYNKFMVATPEFEFRAVRNSSTSYRRSSQNEFAISDSGKQKLIETIEDVFQDELSKSKYFTRVDKPGPDVLLIEGALLDIVSRVPPDIVGRGDIYLDRVGEATLVLQLVDSMSGETLARAADRRAAEPATGGVRASTVTSIAEVRRLARRWATRLREAMDELHDRGPQGSAQ